MKGKTVALRPREARKRSARRPAAPPRPRLDWAYFIDLDGTLLEIAEMPSAVNIDASLTDLIARLHGACGGAVALISGRALSDLDGLLRLPRVPMAGQHGLERRDGAGRLWIHAASPAVKYEAKAILAPALARHAGLLLEDKGLTLALHYRRAPHLAAYARRTLERLAIGCAEHVMVQTGKCVVELKPAGVDKGTAIVDYMAEPPYRGRRPVFVGDDSTDERGFVAINDLGGISIKVGSGDSCARYRLADVETVRAWLEQAVQEDRR